MMERYKVTELQGGYLSQQIEYLVILEEIENSKCIFNMIFKPIKDKGNHITILFQKFNIMPDSLSLFR